MTRLWKKLKFWKRRLCYPRFILDGQIFLSVGLPVRITKITVAVKGVFTCVLHLDPNDVDGLQFINIHRHPSYHKKGDRPDLVIVNFFYDRRAVIVLWTPDFPIRKLSKKKATTRSDLQQARKQWWAKYEAQTYNTRKKKSRNTRRELKRRGIKCFEIQNMKGRWMDYIVAEQRNT